MMLRRHPGPRLSPFVKLLWASDQAASPWSVAGDRERVLPTGGMHLVFRLSDHPLRLFKDISDPIGYRVGHTIVGGARASFYVREVSQPVSSVGAQLRPGAAELLFGVPAGELAGRHTPLEDLCGPFAVEARERLVEAGGLQRQLDVFEALLAARLPTVRGLHPAVAQALERFTTTADVRQAVKESGYSHRRFIALFQRGLGLTPKLYCRVLRFQEALEQVAAHTSASLVEVALDAGYSDQAHFNREFREFAGVSPGEYRELAPAFPHHVPIHTGPPIPDQVNFIQDGGRPRR
jgi:AraC-like DNA-binding protein